MISDQSYRQPAQGNVRCDRTSALARVSATSNDHADSHVAHSRFHVKVRLALKCWQNTQRPTTNLPIVTIDVNTWVFRVTVAASDGQLIMRILTVANAPLALADSEHSSFSRTSCTTPIVRNREAARQAENLAHSAANARSQRSPFAPPRRKTGDIRKAKFGRLRGFEGDLHISAFVKVAVRARGVGFPKITGEILPESVSREKPRPKTDAIWRGLHEFSARKTTIYQETNRAVSGNDLRISGNIQSLFPVSDAPLRVRRDRMNNLCV